MNKKPLAANPKTLKRQSDIKGISAIGAGRLKFGEYMYKKALSTQLLERANEKLIKRSKELPILFSNALKSGDIKLVTKLKNSVSKNVRQRQVFSDEIVRRAAERLHKLTSK